MLIKNTHIIYTLLFLLSNTAFAQNKALDFDGENDYVTLGTGFAEFDGTEKFTLEAWFKLDDLNTEKRLVAMFTSGIYTSKYFLGISSSNELMFHREVAPWNLLGETTLTTGIWYHAVAVYNGTTMTLYLNGIDDGTVSSGNVNASAGSMALSIGGDDNATALFNGQIEEVRIWDDARTQAEIQANMHTELSGTESNLVAYYKMNDGSGTSLTDSSSNSHTGTLTNMDSSTDWVSSFTVGLNSYGKKTTISSDQVNKYGILGGSSGLTANGKSISTSTAPDGLTSATASTSALQIKTDFPSSVDGVYWIANSTINGGTPFQIYADMTTDGGGWTLVLNYLHQGGTNPALAVKTTSFPIQASTTLGTDESAATTNWGHLAPATLNEMPFTQLRFYGKTSLHARIIHFKTTHANTIAYFKTGTGSMEGISTSYTALTGHTAYLPASTTNYFTSEGDNAMTNFPFWLSGTYHWGISGLGSRWEVDDYPSNYANHTFHQIWVK